MRKLWRLTPIHHRCRTPKKWEHASISGNRMGTETDSSSVYRAFRSDQGLVNLAFALKRKNGMEEVVGSIPTRSTNVFNHLRPKSGNNKNAVGSNNVSTRAYRAFRSYQVLVDLMFALEPKNGVEMEEVVGSIPILKASSRYCYLMARSIAPLAIGGHYSVFA
jgi:hypothetical protein